MSKALKCDRCKKCFDPYGADGEFIRIADFVVRDSDGYRNHEVTYRDDTIDLCPACSKSYNDWFAKGVFAKITDPLMKKDGV